MRGRLGSVCEWLDKYFYNIIYILMQINCKLESVAVDFYPSQMSLNNYKIFHLYIKLIILI